MIVQKTLKNTRKINDFEPRGRPRTTQDRPKTAPRPPQDGPRATQDRPRATQDRPRATQDCPKTIQERPKIKQDHPKSGQDRLYLISSSENSLQEAIRKIRQPPARGDRELSLPQTPSLFIIYLASSRSSQRPSLTSASRHPPASNPRQWRALSLPQTPSLCSFYPPVIPTTSIAYSASRHSRHPYCSI